MALERRSVALFVFGLVLAPAPAGAQEQEEEPRPAEAEQADLWARVAAEPYEELPELGSAGFGLALRDTLKGFDKDFLRRSFDDDSDARPDRSKVFHPFGTVAKVVFEPAGASDGMAGEVPTSEDEAGGAQAEDGPPHPYTGLLASGAPGIVRLSLAMDDGRYIPGVAVKLFADGSGPSPSILGIPSFEGQDSADFFARGVTNVLPGPEASSGLFDRIQLRVLLTLQRRAVPRALRLSLQPLAAIDRAGAEVPEPRAPLQIYLEPAEAHLPSDSEADFRELIAEHVPRGTVIYRVYGRDAGEEDRRLLGRLRTSSEFVASEYGDRRLHFVHHEWED